ncbi:MAG: deoxyguanosinetriphosphate triphosphohydrolase [Planctomycetota bacterium]|nr:MAG: deoxyguanosinetriphosphate triphosphohydrolase [Planctomycetota bacterium]
MTKKSIPQNTGRRELENRENGFLAPYAMRSHNSAGRRYEEPPPSNRTHYQRDRDRIVHCTAFRRLEYKTQVFVSHEGDYYRTRLTHTMEVAQIARTIARMLRLNEDLAEAVSYSHDLGHTAFGHSGEDALNELMADHGGFEHNRQSLRVVEVLEDRYPAFRGLNLTFEVRESIIKHTTVHDTPHPDMNEYFPDLRPLLEAQLVEVADSVAYDNHDLDDALKMGIIRLKDIESLELTSCALDTARRNAGNAASERQLAVQTVRHLIDLEISDIAQTSAEGLSESSVSSPDDVRKASDNLITWSDELKPQKNELRAFLMDHVYNHYRTIRMQRKAVRIMCDLFGAYMAEPNQLPPYWRKWIEDVGRERGITDYMAGMTDRYALGEHKKLFTPGEKV